MALDLANWMRELPSNLHDVPITQLSIPGSHDSGAFYLDIQSCIAPGEDQSIKNLARRFPCITKRIVRNWSITQNLSIYEQLKQGIRYLDFRVAFLESTRKFYVVHGLYGSLYSDFFEQVNKFLMEHPKEFLILDFNHFYGFSAEHHQEFMDLVAECFLGKLYASKPKGRNEKDAIDKDVIEKDAIDKDAIDKDAIDKDAIDKDTIEKDAIDKDVIDKDVIEKDASDKDAIEKDPIDKDTIEKDPIEKDAIEKDPIDKDPIDKDAIEKDPIDKDPIDKAAIDKAAIEKDPIDKDAIDKDVIEKDPIDKDAIDKDAIEKDPIDKDVIDKDVIEKDASDKDAIEKDAIDNCAIDEDTIEEGGIEKDGKEERANFSLNDVWDSGANIIALYQYEENAERNKLFWPHEKLIYSKWFNTDKADTLINELNTQLDAVKEGCFNVSQAILTPRRSTIIKHLAGSLKNTLAKKCNEHVSNWLKGFDKEKKRRLNIVICDFIEMNEFALNIVAVNYEDAGPLASDE